VSDAPHLETLPPSLSGEEALSLYPRRGRAPHEVMLFGDGLQVIDAWGAVALRQKIEYHARYQQQRVTLSPPANNSAWQLLFWLLETSHPKHLVLPNEAADLPAARPRNILLSAQPIASPDVAFERVADIRDRAGGELGPAIRFAVAQLPELILNAVTFAESAPTKPVACMLHDRNEDEIQLVVGDLGDAIARNASTERVLEEVVLGRDEGNLLDMAGLAEARELDVSLTLASGTGRLYWRAGRWTPVGEQIDVPGFVVAITVHV
jgi:hypothetical protein